MLTNKLSFLRFWIISDKLKYKWILENLIFVNSKFEKFILCIILMFILSLNIKKKSHSQGMALK